MVFAASFVLLPYYTFNYLISSGGAESRSPLADKSLLVLLILIHYRKCLPVEESTEKKSEDEIDLNSHQKQELYSLNPYNLALENARDVECKDWCLWAINLYDYWSSITPLFFVSWSHGCRGKCTEWPTFEIIFCFFVWYCCSVRHLIFIFFKKFSLAFIPYDRITIQKNSQIILEMPSNKWGWTR